MLDCAGAGATGVIAGADGGAAATGAIAGATGADGGAAATGVIAAATGADGGAGATGVIAGADGGAAATGGGGPVAFFAASTATSFAFFIAAFFTFCGGMICEIISLNLLFANANSCIVVSPFPSLSHKFKIFLLRRSASFGPILNDSRYLFISVTAIS